MCRRGVTFTLDQAKQFVSAAVGERMWNYNKPSERQDPDVVIGAVRSLGVDVRLEPAKSGAPTARSYILITPDGERTMQTYLGACTELAPSDVTPKTFGKPRVVLL